MTSFTVAEVVCSARRSCRMPWRTESVMDQRVEFVLRAKEGEESVAGLCRDYGISRPTGYLWLHRYQELGSVSGLAEHSRRPLHSPQRTGEGVEAAVLALRDKTGWGGPNIASAGATRPPDRVGYGPTDTETWRSSGSAEVEKTKLRFAREQCNELAQMDFKGEYTLAREKCYPLSLLDDCSRYLHGLWPLR